MKFRYGDKLKFDMSGAPTGLSIDNHGAISGFVSDAKPGTYNVTIRVTNSRNGASDSVTLPLIIAGK